MWQLIVLGIIPGTNIQITFSLITNICAVLTVVYLLIMLYSKHIDRLPSYQSPRPKAARAIVELEVAREKLDQLLLHQA